MRLETKALYNSLRDNWLADRSLAVDAWAVEDYRKLSRAEIYSRVKELGLSLDEKNLLSYIDNCEAPEDLIDALWLEEDDPKGRDQAYLLLFELWRRLAPSKLSLSILCDELDHLISLYNANQLEDDEQLNTIFVTLEDVLDNHVDQGADPQKTFQSLMLFCSHNIERFLYDYISDQIESENTTLASELVDGFYDFVKERKWFDFLKARLLSVVDPEEAGFLLHRLLEQLKEEPDLDLLLEVLFYLVSQDNQTLFSLAARQASSSIKVEEDLQEILFALSAYYRRLGNDKQVKEIEKILKSRADRSPSDRLSKDDNIFKILAVE